MRIFGDLINDKSTSFVLCSQFLLYDSRMVMSVDLVPHLRTLHHLRRDKIEYCGYFTPVEIILGIMNPKLMVIRLSILRYEWQRDIIYFALLFLVIFNRSGSYENLCLILLNTFLRVEDFPKLICLDSYYLFCFCFVFALSIVRLSAKGGLNPGFEV